MDTKVGYSASRDDLYYPCKNAQFFPAGIPFSEAALCAEMTRLAYCRNASTFAFNEERIRTVVKSVGFTNCEFFESRGTHCFLAHRPDKLTILTFRGTDADDPTDLGDDADILLTSWKTGGKVHKGFAQALNEVRLNVESALRGIRHAVLFTGHSLGGAMATLMATVRRPDGLYTFGSPKVGDSDFAFPLNDIPIGRYLNCCDLVSRLPPAVFGYVHVGKVNYINFDRQVIFNPESEVIEADQIRARENYIVDYAWKSRNVALRDLADHAPINYVLPVSADRKQASHQA